MSTGRRTLARFGTLAVVLAVALGSIAGCGGGDDVDTSSEAYKSGYETGARLAGEVASGAATADGALRTCNVLYSAFAGMPEQKTPETKRDYSAGCDDGLASTSD